MTVEALEAVALRGLLLPLLLLLLLLTRVTVVVEDGISFICNGYREIIVYSDTGYSGTMNDYDFPNGLQY